MLLLKFCKYFYYIKLYFNRLPKNVQLELVETLENYYNLARIARVIDLSKEVIFECTGKNCRN